MQNKREIPKQQSCQESTFVVYFTKIFAKCKIVNIS
jgi:hypothetical protein